MGDMLHKMEAMPSMRARILRLALEVYETAESIYQATRLAIECIEYIERMNKIAEEQP